MEPLDDKELSELLRQWKAPDAPRSLWRRVNARRGSWWTWLLAGSIRVPVPVGAAVVLLAAVWIYSAISSGLDAPPAVIEPGHTFESVIPPPPRAPSVSLADFQPVVQLEPRIIKVQR